MSDDYTALVAELAALRDRKPHSLKRRFGSRGPTPEQAAAYEAEVREWNREYRAITKRLKAASV